MWYDVYIKPFASRVVLSRRVSMSFYFTFFRSKMCCWHSTPKTFTIYEWKGFQNGISSFYSHSVVNWILLKNGFDVEANERVIFVLMENLRLIAHFAEIKSKCVYKCSSVLPHCWLNPMLYYHLVAESSNWLYSTSLASCHLFPLKWRASQTSTRMEQKIYTKQITNNPISFSEKIIFKWFIVPLKQWSGLEGMGQKTGC